MKTIEFGYESIDSTAKRHLVIRCIKSIRISCDLELCKYTKWKINVDMGNTMESMIYDNYDQALSVYNKLLDAINE